MKHVIIWNIRFGASLGTILIYIQQDSYKYYKSRILDPL